MFDNPKIRINELSVEYDDGTQALSDVCLDIPENAVSSYRKRLKSLNII